MLLSSPNRVDSFVQFITVLFIFVFVLAIALFATRWVAKVQKGMTTGRNMEIIETMRISSTQYIQIVRVGAEYMAIGVSKDNITMLTKIDEAELKLTESEENQNMSFSEVFAKLKDSVNTKKAEAENSDENDQ